MRILITGGFGFIGARLGQHLYHAGHSVVLGSRSASHPPEWLPLVKTGKVIWEDQRSLNGLCKGIEVVVHAAGMNAQECAANPESALTINGVNTERLLYSAIKAGVRRFIYLSTAHVYASPLTGRISEDNCPTNLHPYATSHLAGENAVLYACQHKQIEGVVLRISNGFGAPAQKDINCWMLLVNDLCRQVVVNGKMVLKTSGLQQRDFIPITELCMVIERFIELIELADLQAVFNVGTGKPYSVLEMGCFVQKRSELIFGVKPSLKRTQARDKENHDQLEFRTDKLKKIGIDIETDFSQEIDKLLRFCQSNFKQPEACL